MTVALVTFQARSVIRGRWSLVAIAGFALAAAVVAFLGLGSFRQLGAGCGRAGRGLAAELARPRPVLRPRRLGDGRDQVGLGAAVPGARARGVTTFCWC